jgi:hypothetical protein
VPLASLSVASVHLFQSAVPSGVTVVAAKVWLKMHGTPPEAK